MNAEIERFLEECRATPWFTEHAELLDSLEAFLAKVYRGGDDNPSDQALCDRICEIIGQNNLPIQERYIALADFLAGLLK
jgi:hypothetical protein